MKSMMTNMVVFVILISIFSMMIVFFNDIGMRDINSSKTIPWTFSDFHMWTITIGSLATAIALGFVGYETMMSRNERKNMLRAWVGLGKPEILIDGYFNKQSEFYTKKQWGLLSDPEKTTFAMTKLRRTIEMKNFGQLPATNLQVRTKFLVGKNPTKSDLETETFSSSATIMPNGTLLLYIIVTKQNESDIEDSNKTCYILWETTYDSPNGKQRKYGEIIHLTPNKFGTVDSWN